MNSNPVILVVSDDFETIRFFSSALEKYPDLTVICSGGSQSESHLSKYSPDVIFLDLSLSGTDPVELVAKIHAQCSAPVVVLSAGYTNADKINAVKAGADDYISRPFTREDLTARLLVLQARMELLNSCRLESVFVNGPLCVDYNAGYTTLEGKEIHLTPIEYKILCLLCKNVGKVLTHNYITQTIWGSCWENDIASLRVFMATLRKKLEISPDTPKFIQTQVGVGYRMIKLPE